MFRYISTHNAWLCAPTATIIIAVSPQADQICYAVLCVFSYVAAGHKRRRAGQGGHTHLASGSVSPRGPRFSHNQ